MNKIAIFNHKGGVGKTTLTVNLAIELAASGKRVLLVDSDPQCNLTSYLFEDSVVDDLLDNSDTDNGRTIWSALKPVVEGIGDARDIEPYETAFENLYLIPGDIRLSEFEAELTDFWSQCLQRKPRGFRGTSALRTVVTNSANRLEIDYVFYDIGPNIGPLNRIVLLDCDYFIVAVACDLFSLRALKTLGRTLARWIEEWNVISQLAPAEIDILNGKPKLLGFIPQNFRVYSGRPTSAHKKMLPRLTRDIKSQVISVLKRVNPNLVLEKSGSQLGAVKDFGSLVSESQAQGLPLSQIGTDVQRRQAQRAFSEIAKNIMQRVEE